MQISLFIIYNVCISDSWPACCSAGVSGRPARCGWPAADHGAARDDDCGAVDHGDRLRGGDGGATWIPGGCSCAPCGADCSGKFIVFFLPCCRVLTCFLVVCLRTYLRCTYVLICGILTYLFAVYLRIYLQYTYVLIVILFKNKMWCERIIINFYCSTHPSLTPDIWK